MAKRPSAFGEPDQNDHDHSDPDRSGHTDPNVHAEHTSSHTTEPHPDADIITSKPIPSLKFGVRQIQATIPVPKAVNGKVNVSIEVRTEGSATMVDNFTAVDDLGKPYPLDDAEKQVAMQALGFPGHTAT
jgi:hypothetical protein